MKKTIQMIIAVLMVSLLVTGCAKSGYPVTVNDTKLSKAPEQVVVLSESAASVITALGHESAIVAAPQSYKEHFNSTVQSVGDSVSPDLSAIEKITADLILSGESIAYDVAQEFNKNGRTCITLKAPEKYSELAAYYTALAQIFEGEIKGAETAATYLAELEKSLTELRTANASKSAGMLLYIEEGFVATGDSLPGQLLEMAGFHNIAADKTDYMMSAVDITAADPQYIFCPKGMSETILSNEGLQSVSAVKNGKVYEINSTEIVYAGALLLSSLGEIGNYMV